MTRKPVIALDLRHPNLGSVLHTGTDTPHADTGTLPAAYSFFPSFQFALRTSHFGLKGSTLPCS